MIIFAKSIFDIIVKDFKNEFLNNKNFDFRDIETIDNVYKKIDRIQKKQNRTD